MRSSLLSITFAICTLIANGRANAQALPSTAVQRPPYYMHDYYDALDVYGTGSGYYPATDYPVYPIEGYEYGVDPYDYRDEPYEYWNDDIAPYRAQRYDSDPYDGASGTGDPAPYDADPELGEDTVTDDYDAIPDTHDYGGYDYLGYDREYNYDAHDADLQAEPPLDDQREGFLEPNVPPDAHPHY